MPTKQEIEAQIREVLDQEDKAIELSNQLFRPGGLFHQLAPTEAERRQLIQTPLFREAQTRLTNLQRQEAGAFSDAVEQAKSSILSNEGFIKAGL